MDANDKPPIRIAFVLHVMQVAGAEMLVAEIVRRLGSRIAPIILCLDDIGQLGRRMLEEGVPVVGLQRRPGLDLAVARRLARELVRHQVELIHAHQYTPFFYSALARILVRQPLHLMFTEHGRHYPDVVSRKRRLLNRLLLAKLADEVNGVCAFSARSLAEKDGFEHRQIDVIENGIDLPTERDSETLSARRARVGLPTDRRYVICVARFHPVKDHATLLRAFARVAASAPDTDLLLAGDGPLRPDLQRQVQELGIAPRVSFLGVRDDVPALLKAADIFALTSVSEAASLTLLEAMGAGLPVVVTDVGGNPEIVRSGVEGVLVPRGDVAAAAHAIESLLHDKHLCVRLGAAARQRVVSAYELDSTIMRYYSRYQAAVAGLRKR